VGRSALTTSLASIPNGGSHAESGDLPAPELHPDSRKIFLLYKHTSQILTAVFKNWHLSEKTVDFVDYVVAKPKPRYTVKVQRKE